jgi:hypothetical protein
LVNDLRGEPVSSVADLLHPAGYRVTRRTASPSRRDNAGVANTPWRRPVARPVPLFPTAPVPIDPFAAASSSTSDAVLLRDAAPALNIKRASMVDSQVQNRRNRNVTTS